MRENSRCGVNSFESLINTLTVQCSGCTISSSSDTSEGSGTCFLTENFSSVPRYNLTRLLIWVSQTITPATILNIFKVSVSLGSSQRANIKFTKNGKQVTAAITPTET